jgi:hypothetical protein
LPSITSRLPSARSRLRLVIDPHNVCDRPLRRGTKALAAGALRW